MTFVIGVNVSPYRLIQQIGQGGMATVYKAYHPVFTTDQNFITRFQREVKLVDLLEYPNIVPIYNLTEHEGREALSGNEISRG